MMKRILCNVVLLVFLLVCKSSWAADLGDALVSAGASGGRPLVELFVMAECPYGIRAEVALAPVIQMLGDQVDFRLYYIAEEAGSDSVAVRPREARVRQEPGCSGEALLGTGRFRSLHGDPEIAESIRQLAVMTLYPERFWDYLSCRNRTQVRGDWRSCASQAGIDADRVLALAESAEGEEMFAQNIRRANALGIYGSPTLRVNGNEVRVEAADLVRQVCRDGVNAALCADIPACSRDEDCQQADKVGVCVHPNGANARCEFRDVVPFRVRIVNDPGCAVCDDTPFVHSTLALFPGAQFDVVDVHSEAGRMLVNRYGLDRVPSFVLDAAFEQTARFERFAPLVRRKGDAFLPDERLTPVAQLLKAEVDSGQVDVFLDLSLSASWVLAERVLRWVGQVDAPDRVRLHFLGSGEDRAFRHVQRMQGSRVGDALMCRILERQRGEAGAGACLTRLGGAIVGATADADAALLQAVRERAEAVGVRANTAPAVVIGGRVVLAGAGLGQVEDVFYRLYPEVAQRERQ